MENSRTDGQISKAIQLVSKSEKYQKRLFSFLCLIWMEIALNSLINSMLFTNPLFKCGQIDGSMAYQNETFACMNLDSC